VTALFAERASGATTRNQQPAALGRSLQPASQPISSQCVITVSKTDAVSPWETTYSAPMARHVPRSPSDARSSPGRNRVVSLKSNRPSGRRTSVSLPTRAMEILLPVF
jgi:hypothetical protein